MTTEALIPQEQSPVGAGDQDVEYLVRRVTAKISTSDPDDVEVSISRDVEKGALAKTARKIIWDAASRFYDAISVELARARENPGIDFRLEYFDLVDGELMAGLKFGISLSIALELQAPENYAGNFSEDRLKQAAAIIAVEFARRAEQLELL